MVITKTLSSKEDIQRLRKLALTVPEPVFIRSLDGETSLNVKSTMGIYAMDFSQPVQIETESDTLFQELSNW